MRIGVAIVGSRATELEEPTVDLVYTTARTLHDADTFHCISQSRVTRARLGDQQVGQGHTIHQSAGVAHHQGIVLQADMHRTASVVVTVHQGVGYGFAKGPHIDLGHRHAKQADLQLFLGVVGAEVGFQPVQCLEQWEAAELVEAYRLLGQHLKG
ncbi:hypothetical protein D3C80_1224440 [compost metagenome]